jgi:deferrochelatase/peroxidase EfeB
MLEDLQGNILKGHGRHYTANLFLNFAGEKAKVAASLNSIGRQMPSALDQLRDAAAFSTTKISAGRFLAFFISKEGYAWLGAPAPSSPAHPPHSSDAILESMLDRGADLSDPDRAELDAHFRQDTPEKIIHALLLIGHDGPHDVEAEASRWTWLLTQDGISVVGAEYGRAYFNAANEGLENFGYVDGRSQPLMLAQDVSAEGEKSDVSNPADPASWDWSPIFPLAQFVVKDPGGATPQSFGSYFVFRKLEQDVEGFKNAESEAEDGPDGPASLASALGLKAAGQPEIERERAGAMIVGRYEDGTPFVGSHVPSKGSAPAGGPVANNFNFDGDVDGSLCPFRGHIRKTNPRGDDSRDGDGAIDQDRLTIERSRIMARRGITYGMRTQDDRREFVDRPRTGVGLLFMAYMANIAQQFEVTQRFWANNPRFIKDEAGVDPVIGQTANATAQQNSWPNGYGDNSLPTPFDFGRFVHLKGGEYFFAPSKSFLTNLGEVSLMVAVDKAAQAEPALVPA